MAKPWSKLDSYSSWRKIAMGMWERPNDPTIYGFETVDASSLVPYLDEVSEASGVRVTPTAFCVKMMADILGEHRDLNVLPIGNHIFERENVDIFCQVAIPDESAGQADLSGVKLRCADELDIVEIADILRGKASDVRDGQGVEMEKDKSMVDRIPNALLSGALELIDLVTFKSPLDLEMLGMKNDPFGSCMVTSVGQFDIKQGFAPLLPRSHCPMIALPGKIWKKPVAVDGEPEVRDVITLSCTFDHRCYDGYQIGYVVRGMRERLLNPADFFRSPSHWRDEPANPSSTRSETDKAAE